MEYTGIITRRKQHALALDLTVVVQCITLRERGWPYMRSSNGVTGIDRKRKREHEWNTGMKTCKIIVLHRILHQ